MAHPGGSPAHQARRPPRRPRLLARLPWPAPPPRLCISGLRFLHRPGAAALRQVSAPARGPPPSPALSSSFLSSEPRFLCFPGWVSKAKAVELLQGRISHLWGGCCRPIISSHLKILKLVCPSDQQAFNALGALTHSFLL